MPNYMDNFDIIDAKNIPHNVKFQDRDTLALVTNLATKLNNIKIQNVKEFGATGDGVTDDTQAIVNAFNAGDVIYFPHGNYLFNGSIDISNKTIIGCGISDNIVPIDHGSNILITQTTDTPFNIGSNVTIIGMGFYYPNQDGSTQDPIVYPPTLTYTSSTEVVIENCTFYNSYIAISNTDNNVASGRIIIDKCFIYGIKECVTLNNMYDSVHITNCFITIGIFQDVSITGNAYLAKYTANNGFGITLDGHIDDAVISNNLIYGFFVGIQCTDDANTNLNMIKILDNQIDGCQVAIALNNGTINNSVVSNNTFIQVNRFYTGSSLNCIIINASGITPLKITNNNFELLHAAIECITRTPGSIIFTNNDVHTQGAIGLVGRVAFWVIANNIININNITGSQAILILSGSYHAISNNIIIGDIGIDITDANGVSLTGNLCIGDTKYRLTNVTAYAAANNFTIE